MKYASIVFLLLTTCAASGSQSSTPAPPRIDGHCDAAPYKQFNFWLGNWDVFDKAGALQGHNLVTTEYGGCVVREQWSAPGELGSSFSAYDFRTKKWHQSWFDNSGNTLQMDGGLENGRMVMQGERLTPGGKMALERTTWTPAPNHTVLQIWDYSVDGGKTWTARFEGYYRPAVSAHGDGAGVKDEGHGDKPTIE